MFSTLILSKEFNLSINPTKIELDLKRDSVTDIYLINNGKETIRLLHYFETPIEFKNNGLEEMLRCFPRFIVINPKEQKLIKLLFEKDSNKEFKKNQTYKSYIIFKELPNNSKDISKDEIIVLNEIGIAIIGEK